MSRPCFDLGNTEALREGSRLAAMTARGGVPRSLLRTYCAFANTDGGVILLGVSETEDHRLIAAGVENPDELISVIRGMLGSRRRVNVNILSGKMVHAEKFGGRDIVVIEVPKAKPWQRPVYLGSNPMTGAYIRNFCSNCHCTYDELSAMYRESAPLPPDRKVLEDLDLSVLSENSVRNYREYFRSVRHSRNPWNDLDDGLFLQRIGAVIRDEDGNLRLTLAGLLMFGTEAVIKNELPDYSLEYIESSDPDTGRPYRLSSADGSWSGNVWDFYCQVLPRLCRSRPLWSAFRSVGTGAGGDEIKNAVRELLVNSLIHGDYRGKGGFRVNVGLSDISIENPGSMCMSLKDAFESERSDPRNISVMRMFLVAGISKRAGGGAARAVSALREYLGAEAAYELSRDPERTAVRILFTKQS